MLGLADLAITYLRYPDIRLSAISDFFYKERPNLNISNSLTWCTWLPTCRVSFTD